jgi:hypothetical protein
MMSGSGATCFLLHHGEAALLANPPMAFRATFTR